MFAAALSAVLLVTATEASETQALESVLQARLDAARAEHGFAGATAAVILPGGTLVTVATGEADPAHDVAMRTDHRLLGGSIGKTLVAAAALDLVARGALDLDAPLRETLGGEAWFDRLPNAGTMTLRHALLHETGIPLDYFETEPIKAAIARSVNGPDLAEQGIGHTDLLVPLGGLEPAFPAGEGWHYSDANYVLAALAIEAVTGDSLEAVVRTRLLAPLGLDRIERQRRDLPDLAVPHLTHPAFREMFPGVPEAGGQVGALVYDPQLEWGGGGWAFDAASLARWGEAWFSGAALDSDYLAIFDQPSAHVPAQRGYGYGMGFQLRQDEALGELRYHGGYMLGYIAKVEYVPDHDLTVSLMINEIELAYQDIHADLRAAALEALGRR